MSKRMVFMSNMGHSGGAWLMRVCSMHPEVLMLTEINEVLRLKYVPKKNMYPEVEIDFDIKISQRGSDRKTSLLESSLQSELGGLFLIYQYQIRKEEVIGLIKGFNEKAIKKCKEICNSIKFCLTYRNPISLVNFYSNQRVKVHKEVYEDSFKYNVNLHSKRFQTHLKNMSKRGKCIRLEDLNDSLRDRTPYFKEVMEEMFEVEWPLSLIEETIKKEGYGNDDSEEIWNSWEPWQKNYFMDHFKNIMIETNYNNKFL